mgnify:FL=1
MKNRIVEDLPARKFAPAAAGSAPAPVGKDDKKYNSGKTPEERAKQAVYDIRYKARREDIPLRQAFSEYMQNSSMGGQERNMVKQILFGKEGGGMRAEDFNPIFKNAASDNVAKALFKVFVEKKEINIEDLKEFYTRRNSRGELVFHVRITDKKTGNSYTRDVTREKLNKLRANPNIDIEMSEYRKDSEIERTKGALTARVTAGKGLDYDEDGTVESPAKEYRGAVHNAIQRKKGGVPDGKDTSGVKEEFIHEAGAKKKRSDRLDVRTDIQNTVNMSPTQGENEKVRMVAHNELEGELIAETGYSKFLKKVHSLQEKSVSQNQQQLAAMAIEYLDGNMPDASDAVKQMAKMGRKELKKFAKTKHKGLPEKVKEEMDCGSDDKKKKNGVDNRSLATKINIAKNIVRASTGIKNPMVMVSNDEDVKEGLGLSVGASQLAGRLLANPRTSAEQGAKNFQKNVSDPVGRAVKGAVRAVVQPANMSPEAQKARRDKYRPEEVEFEGEVLDELNRAARERGEKSGGNPAIAAQNKRINPARIGGSRQKPKSREKPPSPSEEAAKSGVLSPLEHKAALRRARRQAAADFTMDTRGT